MRPWPPPALARFTSRREVPAWAPTLLPTSGYVQPLTGMGTAAPVPINQQVGAQAFLSDLRLPASVIGAGKRPQYVPWSAPPGRAGHGLFGGGTIGQLERIHDVLLDIEEGVFEVFEPQSAIPATILGEWLLGYSLFPPADPVPAVLGTVAPQPSQSDEYTDPVPGFAVLGEWLLGFDVLSP